MAMRRSAHERVLRLLESAKWRAKTNGAIAAKLNVSVDTVWKVRRRYGLMPDVIECKNGRRLRTANLGNGNPAALSTRQQEMISDPKLLIRVQELAHWKANRILDESELLSIAHDALITAARYWREDKQQGKERSPGSKWRGYAINGVLMAFRRAFKNARVRLKRTALFGQHPYQKWCISERLREGLADGSSIPEPEPTGLMAQFEKLSPMHRTIIECIAGLDSREPWTIEQLAEHYCVNVEVATQMVNEAKAAMAG